MSYRLFMVRLEEPTYLALANEAHQQSIATGRRVPMSKLLVEALHQSQWFRRGGFEVGEIKSAAAEAETPEVREAQPPKPGARAAAPGPLDEPPQAAEPAAEGVPGGDDDDLAAESK